MMRLLTVLLALTYCAGAETYEEFSFEDGISIVSRKVIILSGSESARIDWPVAVGGEEWMEAANRMNATLDYYAVTGETMEETSETFRSIQRGITGSDYVINFQNDSLMDISISVEFMGAYPFTNHHYFIFDLTSGDRISIVQLIAPGMLEGLVDLLDQRLQENILTAIEEDPDELLSPDDPLFQQHFNVEDLGESTITGEGVIFRHEFAFPHAIQAMEPDGEILLGWEELRPFRE